MRFGNALRFAARELRGGVRGFRILLLCLALSVGAITGIGTVRESIGQGIAAEGAALLGGDAEVTLTYRFASDDERAWMTRTATQVSEIVDFRSLATFGDGEAARRGLTQVKGVDGLYPIYGEVTLNPPIPLAEAFAGQDGLPGGVMDPVLIELLVVLGF
ncbi:MAG: hypothetical protein AAF638_14200 [Pseudomonadota bacterium]